MTNEAVRDLTRAVERLDENAAHPSAETVELMRGEVAEHLVRIIAPTVVLRKVTLRDAALMLAAHGATPFTINQHARGVAARVRALSAAHGSWSAAL